MKNSQEHDLPVGERLDAIRALLDRVSTEPEEDHPECLECGDSMATREGQDPTPLCDPCAQDVLCKLAEESAFLLALVDKLSAEARNLGVVRDAALAEMARANAETERLRAAALPVSVVDAMARTEDDAESCLELAAVAAERLDTDVLEDRRLDAVTVAANGLRALSLLAAEQEQSR